MRTTVVAWEYLPSDLIQAPLFLHFFLLNEHVPNGKVKASAHKQTELPRSPAFGIRITGTIYGTGLSGPGISRSSIAALSDFPWISMASVRVTPPPSALRMTKFSAPILGSS